MDRGTGDERMSSGNIDVAMGVEVRLGETSKG